MADIHQPTMVATATSSTLQPFAAAAVADTLSGLAAIQETVADTVGRAAPVLAITTVAAVVAPAAIRAMVVMAAQAQIAVRLDQEELAAAAAVDLALTTAHPAAVA